MDGRRKTSRIFVFSHPRTASNLLFRIMESHPSLTTKQYPFMDGFMFGPERLSARKTPIVDEFYKHYGDKHAGQTFQKCLDEMETLIKDVESEGKLVMIKEHTVHLMTTKVHTANLEGKRPGRPTPVVEDRFLDVDESQRINVTPTSPLPVPNPTFLSERLLKTLTPVFIIRHPARVFPSYLRASGSLGATVFDDDVPLYLTLKWQRVVLDFYKGWYSCSEGAESAGPGRESLPVVIDGDKLANDPQRQIDKLCQLIGLDPAPIKFSWETKDRFETPGDAAFLSTISKSTGVIKNKDSKPLVLEDEARKWAKQWDEETAQEMKRRVENAMEDYEYLLKHSI